MKDVEEEEMSTEVKCWLLLSQDTRVNPRRCKYIRYTHDCSGMCSVRIEHDCSGVCSVQ